MKKTLISSFLQTTSMNAPCRHCIFPNEHPFPGVRGRSFKPRRSLIFLTRGKGVRLVWATLSHNYVIRYIGVESNGLGIFNREVLCLYSMKLRNEFSFLLLCPLVFVLLSMSFMRTTEHWPTDHRPTDSPTT